MELRVDGVGHVDVRARRNGHVMRLAEFAQRGTRPWLPHHRHSLAVAVQAEDLAREAGGEIQLAVGADQQTAGKAIELPRLDEAAVKVEDLDAAIFAVGDEQLVVRGHQDRMRLIELTRGWSFAAPALDELSGLVEAQHASFTAPMPLDDEH